MPINQDVIFQYELMNGKPEKDTVIPIKIFLKSHKLVASNKNIHDIYSLRVLCIT